MNMTIVPYEYGVCPLVNLTGTAGFIFIGVLLLCLYLISKLIIRIPFITLIFSIGALFYGIFVFPCDQMIGIVISFFAVGIAVSEFM